MPNYMLAYHGGEMPETPEEGEAEMARWMAWMEEAKDALVDPGNPVGQSSTLSADGLSEGGGSNPLSGYTIVKADSFDAAVTIAKGCPHLLHGTIEIAEIIEI